MSVATRPEREREEDGNRRYAEKGKKRKKEACVLKAMEDLSPLRHRMMILKRVYKRKWDKKEMKEEERGEKEARKI